MRSAFRALAALVPLLLVAALVAVFLVRPRGDPATPEPPTADRARAAQASGIEVEPVGYRELFKEVRTVGKLDYNEARVAYITARIAGRIDRLYADFTGIQVRKGDHLAEVYSPDLVTTVQNLLDARQSGNPDLEKVARDRLALWGVEADQLAEITRSGRPITHLTIRSPIGGTVIEKAVRVGQYVREGDSLYRIADLDPIWLYLDVYEYDLAWVRYGQAVDVTLEAYPGEAFRGTVTFIDPFLDDKTRTVKVRVNLKNPERKLKPAMYASALIRVQLRADGSPEPTGIEGKYICPMHPEVVRNAPGKCPVCEMKLERVPDLRPVGRPAGHEPNDHGDHSGHRPAVSAGTPGQVLAVRATAVLQTGRRAIVYRQRPDGAYELVEVTLGPRAEGKDDAGQATSFYPVVKGLKVGDLVVIRGGFLLDSQRQIEGMPSLLYPDGQAGPGLHAGHGGPAAGPGPAGHKH